jgi:hypothetical protein
VMPRLRIRASGREIGQCAILAAALLAIACGSSKPASRDVVVWQKLGSWSGSGSRQTESFEGETGALRVRWEARSDARPVSGTLRITLHSAVSGRPLSVAVDQQGAGSGTAYVNEDPRTFFFVIDSANLDWSFMVDEQITMTVSGK